MALDLILEVEEMKPARRVNVVQPSGLVVLISRTGVNGVLVPEHLPDGDSAAVFT
jgi:hypothetical protein